MYPVVLGPVCVVYTYDIIIYSLALIRNARMWIHINVVAYKLCCERCLLYVPCGGYHFLSNKIFSTRICRRRCCCCCCSFLSLVSLCPFGRVCLRGGLFIFILVDSIRYPSIYAHIYICNVRYIWQANNGL